MSRLFHQAQGPEARERKAASEGREIAARDTGGTAHCLRGPVGDPVIAVHLAIVLFATSKIIALLARVVNGP